MDGPTFKAELRLLVTDQGGKTQPVFTDYRPNWNLGNTWLGEPQLNDGRVMLDAGTELPPGDAGLVRIVPLASEFWGNVRRLARVSNHEHDQLIRQNRVHDDVRMLRHLRASNLALDPQPSLRGLRQQLDTAYDTADSILEVNTATWSICLVVDDRATEFVERRRVVSRSLHRPASRSSARSDW